MKKVMASALALGVVLSAQAAFAEEAPTAPTAAPAPAAHGMEFGDKGSLNIGAETKLNLEMNSAKPPSGDSTSETKFGVGAQVAYFVADGLSIGANLGLDYKKPENVSAVTAFGIGPSVGFNYWITPGSLSLWPQVDVMYVSASSTLTIPNGTSTSSTDVSASMVSAGVFVPVLIHPVSHFHFGVGPYFRTDLTSTQSAGGNSTDGVKNTSFGIQGEIAGWM